MGRKTKNEPEETYFYDGEMLTAKELAKHTEVGYRTLYSRLRAGWSVERALRLENDLDPEWHNKDLLVSFPSKLAGVFPEMQPGLNKPYIAYYNRQTYSKHSSKHFFIIYLDNGKKLIVYPHEFNIIREAFPAGMEG